MPPGGMYIPTRIWWAKRPTWKLTICPQLWLRYQQEIGIVMTYAPNFECRGIRLKVRGYGKL